MKRLVLAFMVGIAFNLIRGEDVAIWSASVDWTRVALASVFLILFILAAFCFAPTRVVGEKIIPAVIAGVMFADLFTHPPSQTLWILTQIAAILVLLWWARPAKRITSPIQ